MSCDRCEQARKLLERAGMVLADQPDDKSKNLAREIIKFTLDPLVERAVYTQKIMDMFLGGTRKDA